MVPPRQAEFSYSQWVESRNFFWRCRGKNEKFLFGQSREFRFDEAWRNAKRSCGCRYKTRIR